jgi:hypothetical protein
VGGEHVIECVRLDFANVDRVEPVGLREGVEERAVRLEYRRQSPVARHVQAKRPAAIVQGDVEEGRRIVVRRGPGDQLIEFPFVRLEADQFEVTARGEPVALEAAPGADVDEDQRMAPVQVVEARIDEHVH